MLMDTFYELAPTSAKTRVHLHAFTRDQHLFLQAHKNLGASQAIDLLGLDLSRQFRLMAIDEFRITDAYDASVISRLFKVLFDNGVVVVATSNMAPRDFVGLPDDDFLVRLQRHCRILDLGSDVDYRQVNEGRNSLVIPKRQGVQIESADPEDALRHIIPPSATPAVIDAGFGRVLTVPHSWWPATGAVTFDWLCGNQVPALGPADYLALTRRFQLLIVGNVPKLGAEPQGRMGDASRRFASLLDVFYDTHTSLAVTTKEKKLFDFEVQSETAPKEWLANMKRAESRWTEMIR